MITGMKKAVSILLTVILAASFAACKKEKQHSAKDDPSTAIVSDIAGSSVSGQSQTSTETRSEPQAEPEPDTNPVPEEWRDGGIFSDYYEQAYNRMMEMSTEEKVGQIILASCPDTDAYQAAQEYHLGGYVLFQRHLEDQTKDDVIRRNRSYMESQDIPMIIATDEEGGTVSRLNGNADLTDDQDFLSPREVFDIGGMDAIKEDALRKALLLNDLGINTNLAPVCDICTGEDKFMYDRSLGQSTSVTSAFVEEVTRISQTNGVSVTLKHFPGYGNNTDTHYGIAVDKRTYETFDKIDFEPFRAGIAAGAHVVMVSHNIVECMDGERPASLSMKVHEILRNELGFTGVIITDDLGMGAIEEYSPEQSVFVNALLCGNDMLCVNDYEGAYEDVMKGVKNGEIDRNDLNHSVMRVLAWKYAKGMITD